MFSIGIKSHSILPAVASRIFTANPAIVSNSELFPVAENPAIVSNSELSVSRNIFLQSLVDTPQQYEMYSNFASVEVTPQILTEFTPINNTHTEISDHEKRIQLLEEKEGISKIHSNYLKLSNQVKKLSKKIDDIRNDVQDSEEHMAKQINILASDVEILTALIDDDDQ